MQVNPVLEKHGPAKPGIWYVVSPCNERPCARVGHTCCVLKTSCKISHCASNGTVVDDDEPSEKLLFIGGANPDGAFSDAYILDFGEYKWFECNWKGLSPRYEHSAFIPINENQDIVVFGGAQMDKNLNDVWVLENGLWCLSVPSGRIPTPRTCHSAVALHNKLYVFGGGESGTEPTQDRKLHVYDAKENCWSQPFVQGESPTSRHGHVMVTIGNNIYIHGGMAGAEMFADLWKLTISDEDLVWSQPKTTGDIPCKMAAHAGCAVHSILYLFGGMNENGASMDDLHSLNTDSMVWQRICCDGPPPHCRLDHTMCSVTVSRSSDDEQLGKVRQTFIVVFGGMDAVGQIFDDCLAFLVSE